MSSLLGKIRFLAVYLLSAVGGSLMYYYLVPHRAGRRRVRRDLRPVRRLVRGRRRLRLDSRGIVAADRASTWDSASIYRSTIAWQDHIGGLIIGALLTAAYVYAPRKNQMAFQVAATVLLVVLMVIAAVIRTGQLTA